MSNMVINTNVKALNSHRNLATTGAAQMKSSARLSSGFKINSAADDAAGLAISEKMRSQIRGLDMASKNTQDGVSLIQTAEGGMQEIDNMLQRMRELVNQASNDTNEHNTSGTGDRQKLQDELNQLTSEIDSMAGRVEFNNKKVIDGSYSDMAEQLSMVKAEATVYSDQATNGSLEGAVASVSDFKKLSIGGVASDVALTNACLEKAVNSTATETDIKLIKSSIEFLNECMDMKKSSLNDKSDKAAKIQANDIKYDALKTQAEGMSALTEKGTKSLHLQVGANTNQSLMVNIGSVKSDALGIGNGNGISKIDIRKDSGSDTTGYLNVLDKALSYVSTERSKLGATQNRLEYTQKSLEVSSENLSAAESRIRDADMAKEMMKMTTSNVLQSAATSMLAQANQSPQNVLQLLQ